MGKLALAGAIGGIGAGIQTNATLEQERETADIEEQRLNRLEQIKQKNAEALATHESDLALSNTRQIRAEDNEFTGAIEMQEDTHESSENALQRQHELALQKLRNSGSLAVSKRSTSSSGWNTEQLTETGEDGFTTNETIVATKGPITLIQRGQVFIPQGVDISEVQGIDDPTFVSNMVNWIKQNPGNEDMVLREYGFLPFEAITSLSSTDTVSQSRNASASLTVEQ